MCPRFFGSTTEKTTQYLYKKLDVMLQEANTSTDANLVILPLHSNFL